MDFRYNPRTVTYLATAEAAAIDELVARIESRTGAQIATAIVRRSDAYTELPWKAFALGASLSGFALVLYDAWRPDWVMSYTALAHAAVILLTGMALAAVAVFSAPFARLLLRRHRAEIEVRRYAESMFFRRGLFRTRDHSAVLILVSVFERRIEILADQGLQSRVSEAEWHGVIARMTPHLRRERPFNALREALEAVEALLVGKGVQPAPGAVDELPNRTIEETGA
jgi:putative membrane protein